MKTGPAQSRMQNAADRLARTVCAVKSQWLDGQMKRILPPELYALSTENSNQKLRARVEHWISENKITIHEDGDRTDLLKDGLIISIFAVRFKDGKAEVMSREFPLTF